MTFPNSFRDDPSQFGNGFYGSRQLYFNDAPAGLEAEMEIERNLTIAEMAATFSVSHRSLRFYEQRGLLHPLRRGTTRYYSRSDSIRLQLVLKGKRLGFSLEEIARLILDRDTPPPDDAALDATAHLSPGQIAAQLAALAAKRQGLEAAIAELQQALAGLPSPCEREPT